LCACVACRGGYPLAVLVYWTWPLARKGRVFRCQGTGVWPRMLGRSESGRSGIVVLSCLLTRSGSGRCRRLAGHALS